MRLETKKGNKPKDQKIVFKNGAEYFVSYDTNIVRYESTDSIILDRNYWDYSTTTGYYRNQFLGEGIAETRKKISNGTYKLADLNWFIDLILCTGIIIPVHLIILINIKDG